ncbi:hypothetical protein HYPDE_26603 [Hyphomicrobium denitrificans 1NES1]|uniref:DUF2924 domain-containing protein n=1 Tax=Hyphomicrobium denitrificans 1NES1 TaxID=670307 RepID=N0B903_9HYPH|nr:DUF2924 domain-containing protein [Hyphomicrobium denitrificans]AGK57001.1 hypothetical protein HYPDE_26603 [Hyphomicrobium denitrificans 1NES1]
MTSDAIDVAAELTRLEVLTNFELRSEWRRLHGMQPPKSLSRDLLLRGITYKIQERAFGGLSKSVLRRLSGAVPDVPRGVTRKATQALVKPGTRLVREWNGQTHTVLVHTDGVEWRGKRYRSLSVVAREITGAHWSGPRFFGLDGRSK